PALRLDFRAFPTRRSSDLRTTGFDAVSANGGSAAVESLRAGADAGLSSLVGRALTKSERPELTSARVVVSGGRGMGSGDNFKVLDRKSTRLNSSHGSISYA